MSERIGPVEGMFGYDLYVYKDGSKGHWVGGASGEDAACTLASGWLQTAQQLYPTAGTGIGVTETATGAMVAYLSWEQP